MLNEIEDKHILFDTMIAYRSRFEYLNNCHTWGLIRQQNPPDGNLPRPRDKAKAQQAQQKQQQEKVQGGGMLA